MSRNYEVEVQLDPDELEQLRAYVREQNGTRTVDECFTWCQAHGFTGSRTAVWTWLSNFREEMVKERFTRSSELAKAINGALAGGQFEDIADASVRQLTQVVFEQSAMLQADGKADSKEVLEWSKTLNNLIGSKTDLAEYKASVAESLKLAEKQIKEGKSATDIVATIKQALLI